MRMLLVLATLASLPISASAGAQTPPKTNIAISEDGMMLDVSVEGRTTRIPDVATIRAGVVSQGSSAAAALADNAQRIPRILAVLKQAGIAARDISTSNVSLTPQYRETPNQPPVIAGYQATNTLSIRFRDVGKSGAILDALVSQGANQIEGPNLSIDQLDTAFDEARVDALRRAQTRADLYAHSTGLRVARIVSIAEAGNDSGGMPLAGMREMSASDSTQVIAGRQDVKITLSVRFLLRK